MPRIALTFDDGPAPWTEPILDILAENGAHATFFTIGSLIGERGDVLRRMVAENHEVGNHTWSHPRLAEECDDERIRDELQRTNELLTEILGFAPHRFRAPQYNVDARVEAVASTLGLTHTTGHVRPPDWDARCTAPSIIMFVLQRVRPDAIIGLHDGVSPKRVGTAATRQPTVDAVAALLPRLTERGYECVTASALLEAAEPD